MDTNKQTNLQVFYILGAIILIAFAAGAYLYSPEPEQKSFTIAPGYQFAFDLTNPALVKLPNKLKEISGLEGWTKEDQLLAIEDENGVFFVINGKEGKVLNTYKFSKDRDYEAITRNGNDIYILEADGDIYHLTYSEEQLEYDALKMETDFKVSNDLESMCYDSMTQSLLLAPKEKNLKAKSESGYLRKIYSFDLKTNQLVKEALYSIDQLAVGQAILGRDEVYFFKPSDIAVDPVSNDIYLIASVGNILIVIDRQSQLQHIELLDKGMFGQPEGISFDVKGNLYISSEGRGGKAVIACFKRG